MNVNEIITELQTGKRIVIAAEDAWEFMRECARYRESGSEIKMHFRYGRCAMTMSKHEQQKRRDVKEKSNNAK